MFSFFKKKKDDTATEDDGIRVIRRSDPLACGGTDATVDTRAPKTINSDEITLFSVESALGYDIHGTSDKSDPLMRVSAFAVKTETGTFLCLHTEGFEWKPEANRDVSGFVKADLMPDLASIVKEYDLAAKNGYHSRTHGLPENFGGEVRIEYASGEKIGFSDNQTPIIQRPFAHKVIEVFENALAGEKVDVPDVKDVVSLTFTETRKDGGFSSAKLTLLPDGTGISEKKQKFDDPTVYESKKEISAETVKTILDAVKNSYMLAWKYLPERRFKFDSGKSVTFVFKDGSEITSPDGRDIPYRFSNAMFTIDLELITKN